MKPHDPGSGAFGGHLPHGVSATWSGGRAEPGDSGGPVDTVEKVQVGTDVKAYVTAKGIINGGSGFLGYRTLRFTDIHDARQAFGGDVMKRQ
ncbi:hypothetical protein GCM10010517_34250 [Streptosporangium fragile]|uniref:Uncharacterized protein n=1 Tax=Streptosporangium fragile TaxID=46186 RepID=A0ABN3VYC6_9ACTN